MADSAPSTHGGGGRGPRGRFVAGNRLGIGNPLAGRAAKIRSALLQAATPADVQKICRRLIQGAKGGDLAFIREWLDRTVGKPAQTDVLDRIEELERLVLERRADQ